MEVAVQMAISEVASEDPRFLEREAPPLSEEFKEGSKIFFLGEHAYGVAAKIASTTDDSLSVILAVRIYPFYCPGFNLLFRSSFLQTRPRRSNSKQLLTARLPNYINPPSRLRRWSVYLVEPSRKSLQVSWLSPPIIRSLTWA